MTYGVLPSKVKFEKMWEAQGIVTFKVRNCKIVGDHDFTLDELYSFMQECVDNNENLDWVSSALSVFGIEWILGGKNEAQEFSSLSGFVWDEHDSF